MFGESSPVHSDTCNECHVCLLIGPRRSSESLSALRSIYTSTIQTDQFPKGVLLPLYMYYKKRSHLIGFIRSHPPRIPRLGTGINCVGKSS